MKRFLALFLGIVMMSNHFVIPVYANDEVQETVQSEDIMLMEETTTETLEIDVNENVSDEVVESESLDEIVIESEETETFVLETVFEETEESLLAALETEEDIEETEVFECETFVYVNPIYDNLFSEADILNETSDGKNVSFFENTEYLATEEEVIQKLRNGMEYRSDVITINYVTTEEFNQTVFEYFIDSALAETGSPTQGDYILLNYRGASIPAGEGSYYILDNQFYYSLNIHVLYYTTYEQEEAVTAEVNNVLGSFNFGANTTDYVKVKTIYDWVCDNVTYDHNNLNDTSYLLKYSTYAALINKTSVCQGYSSLVYRMFRESGLSVRSIRGTSSGVGHAWNIVGLGDYYYNLDATWDAGMPNYIYFLKSNDNFANHTRDAEYETDTFNTIYPMADSDYEYVADKTIKDEHVTLEYTEHVYTGKKLEPTVIVTVDGTVLIQDRDYTVAYESNRYVYDMPKVIISGINNWAGTIEKTFTITEAQYDDMEVTFDKEVYEYTGSSIYPTVKLKYKDTTYFITSTNSSYYVQYFNNVKVSTEDNKASLSFELKDINQNFEQMRVYLEFDIVGKDISGYTVTLSNTLYDYTGNEILPAVDSVVQGTKTLTENTDYTVRYKNNINAGTGTVYIDGIGNYSGTVEKTFRINPISISKAMLNMDDSACIYNGESQYPNYELIYNDSVLEENVDYEVLIEDNIDAGAASIKFVGMGNFKNLWAKAFIIDPASIEAGNVVLEEGENYYTGNALEPSVQVTLGENELIDQKDYEVSYKNNIEIGTATVIVEGKGNYAGTLTQTFDIIENPYLALGTCGENLTWTLDKEGALKISGFGMMDGYWDGISPWHEYREDIISIEFPEEGMKNIGANAFKACINVETVVIPEGIEIIELAAFYQCSGLKSVEIPSGGVELANGVFDSCTALESVILAGDITGLGGNSFADCPNLKYVIIKGNALNTYDMSIISSDMEPWFFVPEGATGYDVYPWNEYKIIYGSYVPIDLLSGYKISDSVYNGMSQKPEIVITDGNYTLVEGTDYTVEYQDNINAGTGKAIITGKGWYGGQTTKTFVIEKAENTLDVSIDVNSIGIKESALITAEGYGTITYESSNPSIATVDSNGVVTGVKAGRVTITVTADAGNDYKSVFKTIDVEVIHTEHVYDNDLDMVCNQCEYERTVKQLEIDTSSVKTVYYVNEKLDLTALKVKAYYSDGTEAIVTEECTSEGFDSSKEGTCIIQIAFKGKTISFSVVIEAYTAENIVLNENELNGYIGQTIQLIANCTPKLPSVEKLEWLSSDENIAEVDENGNVVLISEGIVTITVSAGGKQADCTITITEGKWIEYSEGYRYQRYDGSYPCSEWKTIDGILYYFNDSGYRAEGWEIVDGRWYYFNAEGVLERNRWIGSYYVDEDGMRVTSAWVDNGKYYVDETGAYISKTGWFQLNENYYYLIKGKKQTGWIQAGSTWYYMNPETGIMLSNEWLRDTYYFKSNGAMATGWFKLNGDYYYFNSGGAKVTDMWVGNYYLKADGIMAANEWVDNNKYYVNASGVKNTSTGWFKLDGEYYYLKSGEKQTGWLKAGSYWYYLDSDTGLMLSDEWLENTYYLKSNGAMATGWVSIDGDYYYFNGGGIKVTNMWIGNYYLKADGIMATDEWVDDGKYYVNSSGAYVSKTGWFKLDGEYYYLKSGKKQTGWLEEGNKWYYLDPQTGIMLSSEWLNDTYYLGPNGAMVTGLYTIDGVEYFFNSSGKKS